MSPLKPDARPNMAIMDGIRHHQRKYYNIMTIHVSRRETAL
jgi:hypothetical protein